MTPSLEGWSTKTKETPSPHEVKLTLQDTNLVFHCIVTLGLLRKTTLRAAAIYLYHVLCWISIPIKKRRIMKQKLESTSIQATSDFQIKYLALFIILVPVICFTGFILKLISFNCSKNYDSHVNKAKQSEVLTQQTFVLMRTS